MKTQVGPQRQGMSLHEAMRGYLMDSKIQGQAPLHVAHKKQRLARFVVYCEGEGVADVEAVTVNVLRGFILLLQEAKTDDLDSRKKNHHALRATTVKGYKTTIRVFFAWCVKEQLIASNPCDSLPSLKTPHYLIPTFSPEQMMEMLDTCDIATQIGARDYAMLLVFMDTGVRVSELCTMRLEDFHESYITVFGKGSKEREVGIAPTASKAVWRYIHQFRGARTEHERHIFLSRTGRPLTRNEVDVIVKRVGEAAGIEGVRISAHTLRHTFARLFLKQSGDIYRLSRLLGHADVKTTENYLKDFTNRDARHNFEHFSPVETWKLGRKRSKKKSKQK